MENMAATSRILCVEETGSTNDDLKAIARAGAVAEPCMISSRSQTAGRGTRGRKWVTDETSLIYSVALRTEGMRCPLTMLPLAAGISVCRVMRRHGTAASVKWPNDIWFDGGKAGGILCESLKDAEGKQVFIAGIGLNARGRDQRTTHGWPVTGLGMHLWQSDSDRKAVLAELLDALTALCSLSADEIMALWPEYDAFLGKTIHFQADSGDYFGSVSGIDESGRLLLTNDGVTSAFTAGNVTNDNVAD